MNILFVTSRFPYPPIRGDQARAYHQMRLLARRHRICLAAPEPASPEALDAIRPLCARIELLPARALRRVARFAARLPFSRLPLQTLYYSDPGLARAVARLCRGEHPEVVHFCTARVAPASASVRDAACVIDFIDSLALNMKRRAEIDRSPIRLVARFEFRRLARYERALAASADGAVVSSDTDADFIGRVSNLHVVANGVDLERFPFVSTPAREADLIVFTGRMGYFPNCDAAVHFASEVMPQVRRRVASARFVIVGPDMPKAAARRCRAAGAVVTGHVADIHEWLARATAAVAPMRAGSGMQFKVIEAMASGTPVIATPFALGGLGVIDGEHLLVASDAREMAAKVVRILCDRKLARGLATNARALVERNYSWERSVADLERIYELAIKKARGGLETPPIPPAAEARMAD